MLRDPGHIAARASGGEHGGRKTPAQRGRLEEDRRFGAEELRIGALRRGGRWGRSRFGSAPDKIEHKQAGCERGDHNNENGKLPPTWGWRRRDSLNS